MNEDGAVRGRVAGDREVGRERHQQVPAVCSTVVSYFFILCWGYAPPRIGESWCCNVTQTYMMWLYLDRTSAGASYGACAVCVAKYRNSGVCAPCTLEWLNTTLRATSDKTYAECTPVSSYCSGLEAMTSLLGHRVSITQQKCAAEVTCQRP